MTPKHENYTNLCSRWWKKLLLIYGLHSTQHRTRWTRVTYKSM